MCRVRLYLVSENDEIPQQRHSACHIPSQIKTLLGILFPIISLEQACRAEATQCLGETVTKKKVLKKNLN